VAIDPDPFVSRAIGVDRATLRAVLDHHRRGLRQPALTQAEYIDALVASGLRQTVDRLFG
jgi:hypothetical protein